MSHLFSIKGSQKMWKPSAFIQKRTYLNFRKFKNYSSPATVSLRVAFLKLTIKLLCTTQCYLTPLSLIRILLYIHYKIHPALQLQSAYTHAHLPHIEGLLSVLLTKRTAPNSPMSEISYAAPLCLYNIFRTLGHEHCTMQPWRSQIQHFQKTLDLGPDFGAQNDEFPTEDKNNLLWLSYNIVLPSQTVV